MTYLALEDTTGRRLSVFPFATRLGKLNLFNPGNEVAKESIQAGINRSSTCSQG